MKKRKLVLGVVGALMMLVCTFFLAFYTLRDYYVAQRGAKVQGRVVNNSSVCKKWNKFVAVEYARNLFEIRLYGPDCRAAEFRPNQLINLRSADGGKLVVLESNRYTIRACFMVAVFLLSMVVNILMYNQYRFWKRSLAKA
ncbi:MAG: hypothetical protein DI535_09625 [Citrobacter freundii]|nr:MAG: hypothetical protein DI535_09625 [Citrobacter freundii]